MPACLKCLPSTDMPLCLPLDSLLSPAKWNIKEICSTQSSRLYYILMTPLRHACNCKFSEIIDNSTRRGHPDGSSRFSSRSIMSRLLTQRSWETRALRHAIAFPAIIMRLITYRDSSKITWSSCKIL
jgi:hypothetical protein